MKESSGWIRLRNWPRGWERGNSPRAPAESEELRSRRGGRRSVAGPEPEVRPKHDRVAVRKPLPPDGQPGREEQREYQGQPGSSAEDGVEAARISVGAHGPPERHGGRDRQQWQQSRGPGGDGRAHRPARHEANRNGPGDDQAGQVLGASETLAEDDRERALARGSVRGRVSEVV